MRQGNAAPWRRSGGAQALGCPSTRLSLSERLGVSKNRYSRGNAPGCQGAALAGHGRGHGLGAQFPPMTSVIPFPPPSRRGSLKGGPHASQCGEGTDPCSSDGGSGQDHRGGAAGAQEGARGVNVSPSCQVRLTTTTIREVDDGQAEEKSATAGQW